MVKSKKSTKSLHPNIYCYIFQQNSKDSMTRNSFQTEPVRGAKSVLVMFFLFLLLYSFDFLRIFKDGVHNKKTVSPWAAVRILNVYPTPPPQPPCWLCVAIAAPPTVVSVRIRKLICSRAGNLLKVSEYWYLQFVTNSGVGFPCQIHLRPGWFENWEYEMYI